MTNGFIRDFTPDHDYWKRTWTQDEETPAQAGVPLSVDFEDLVDRYSIPNGLQVQRFLWQRGFVTPTDWLKAGIHDALMQALRSYGYGDKRACMAVAADIIREIRKDVE